MLFIHIDQRFPTCGAPRAPRVISAMAENTKGKEIKTQKQSYRVGVKLQSF